MCYARKSFKHEIKHKKLIPPPQIWAQDDPPPLCAGDVRHRNYPSLHAQHTGVHGPQVFIHRFGFFMLLIFVCGEAQTLELSKLLLLLLLGRFSILIFFFEIETFL